MVLVATRCKPPNVCRGSGDIPEDSDPTGREHRREREILDVNPLVCCVPRGVKKLSRSINSSLVNAYHRITKPASGKSAENMTVGDLMTVRSHRSPITSELCEWCRASTGCTYKHHVTSIFPLHIRPVYLANLFD